MATHSIINFPLTSYKNFIFDFAGVLFHCDYIKFVTQAFPIHTNHQALVDVIFNSKLFSDYDKNLIDTEELTLHLVKALNCQPRQIDCLIAAIKEYMVPIEEMVLFLHELKEKQVKLYGLTNMPKPIFNHLIENYSFLNLFEDITVSAHLGLTKPDLAIYQHVLSKNEIDPRKTIFIDDRLVNLPPAEQLGIKAFLYTNIRQLVTDLRNAMR